LTAQSANPPHASDNEDDDEQQQQVRKQRVDAQHDEENGIVAAEIAEVVVDPALGFAEVCRLRETFDVEELAQ